MPWFRCLVRGANFPGHLSGMHGLIGFRVTRFCEAATPREAEDRVMRRIWSDPRLASLGPPNDWRYPPVYLYSEQIVEVAEAEVPPRVEPLVWHPMDDDGQER